MPVAAHQPEMSVGVYSTLVVSALKDQSGAQGSLSTNLELALSGYLPARRVSVAGIPAAAAGS